MKRWTMTFLLMISGCACIVAMNNINDSSTLTIKKTTDFKITGKGDALNWQRATWLDITVQEAAVKETRVTKIKILYSDKGLYFLFFNEDEKLTATYTEDFAPLFREDVVEVFLWPDVSVPVYFEYELSPLNYEMILLVPNINGQFRGWRPAHYGGEIKTEHATFIVGGEKKSQATIGGWIAEFFIPFSLLQPLASTPVKGTRWRGNLYRIDYDHEYSTWSWQKTTPYAGANFHEYNKFGTFVFE